ASGFASAFSSAPPPHSSSRSACRCSENTSAVITTKRSLLPSPAPGCTGSHAGRPASGALAVLLEAINRDVGAVARAPAARRGLVIAIERAARERQVDPAGARDRQHGAEILAHAVDVEADLGARALLQGLHQLRSAGLDR